METPKVEPILPAQKHFWLETGDKPWTCRLCGLYTANLRHIENGYCFHDWSKKLNGLECCSRCGVVKNSRNVSKNCIGNVSLDLRAEAYASRPEAQAAPARIAELEKALAEETYMCLQLRQQIEQMMPEAQMRVVNFQRAETQIQPSRTTAQCVRCGENKPVPENYPSALLICSDCAAKDKPQQPYGVNVPGLASLTTTGQLPYCDICGWEGGSAENGHFYCANAECPNTKPLDKQHSAPESTALRRAAEELWKLHLYALTETEPLPKEAWIAAKIAQWTKGE